MPGVLFYNSIFTNNDPFQVLCECNQIHTCRTNNTENNNMQYPKLIPTRILSFNIKLNKSGVILNNNVIENNFMIYYCSDKEKYYKIDSYYVNSIEYNIWYNIAGTGINNSNLLCKIKNTDIINIVQKYGYDIEDINFIGSYLYYLDIKISEVKFDVYLNDHIYDEVVEKIKEINENKQIIIEPIPTTNSILFQDNRYNCLRAFQIKPIDGLNVFKSYYYTVQKGYIDMVIYE